ncbi:M56 family metallopeptidase [Papillibacter cinnamivorans]|uniref:Signal transducer regulating beta-lactamase production, contains metallopeptidase domain n=1 Tax=Papillibacter cinnamivorans DSM 12816 TaxID=1122930 RepID=A0A1W1YN48_9FIRM|nr:M56 family metallopeptidase [Papillibacter cinnamivorans]SMC37562.1 Signal transducer regulating beta-lactamase production, contains metallopeptidase domain [Papillibacter cinnamivorans DSM 12816]
MTETILSASALILILTALRRILRGKISLRLQYALWALVLFRLLLPFSLLPSSMSVLNSLNLLPGETVENAGDAVSSPVIPVRPVQAFSSAEEYKKAYAADHGISPGEVPEPDEARMESYARERASVSPAAAAKVVWYCGIAAVGICLVASNLLFYRKLRKSRRRLDIRDFPLPVYEAEGLPSPCLFGLFRPAVYLTPETSEEGETRKAVLAHEITHFRHLDHIWALGRCACLALHWYNPLVWLAAALSRRDAELACDEGAIRLLGEDRRMEYGRTLIGLTARRGSPGQLLYCATTMTSGKRGIRERITLIAKKPRMLTGTLATVLLIAALAAGCTFTGAKESTVPESTVPVTLYERSGITIAIPEEYADQVLVDPADNSGGTELLHVYDKSVYEKYEGMGWLFTIVRYTQAQYEQFLSSDGSGQSFFAKDDSYYYGFFIATDVQSPDDSETFSQLLSALGDFVKSDMVSRNSLTVYSDSEFFDKAYTYEGEHVFIKYYPYYASEGRRDIVWTLVLSRPVRQDDTGIWCVERWMDANGYTYPYFPDADGASSEEYYVNLQARCDAGHETGLLDPEQVALSFIGEVFGHAVNVDSIEVGPDETGSFEASSGNIDDYLPTLMEGGSVSAYDLLPCFENFTRETWPQLERDYGADFWDPLWVSLRDAALGYLQEDRDYYIAKAYLTSDGAYSEGLDTLLAMQWRADSALESQCLSERFSDEEEALLRQAIVYTLSYTESPYCLSVPEYGAALYLDKYPLEYPFGYSLPEGTFENHTAESFGKVTVVRVNGGGLEISYLHPADGVFYVFHIRSTAKGSSVLEVAVGDSLGVLEQRFKNMPLETATGLINDGDEYFGAHDAVYVYHETEESILAIVYVVKDGFVTGIEIVSGLDGRPY